MSKPLSATKGKIIRRIFFTCFLVFVVLTVAIVSSMWTKIANIGTQQILSGQIMSVPRQQEEFVAGTAKPSKTVKPTAIPVPTQVKQKTNYKQPVFVPPPTPKAPYPVCVVYYPSLNKVETYTTFSPEYCVVVKAQASSNTTGGYVIPDIAGQAENQFDHINDNLKNTTIVEHTPTPNPCSNINGSANIVGGSCN